MPRTLRSVTPFVALLLALTLVAAACGDDKKDSSASDKTTTTAKEMKTTTTGAGGSSTTLVFSDALDKAEASLEQAKGDPCALAEFFGTLGSLPDPKDEAEGKRAVAFLVTLLNSVADTAPATEAQAKADLQQAAKDLQAEGEAAGYSKEWLTAKDSPKALSDPKVTAAMTSFQTQTAKQCGGGSTPSTTTAG
jgi:hypothetical protein